MQSLKSRWQTLLSFGILLALLVSAAGYFYWANRPFTLEQLAPVDTPTLVHTITTDQRKPFAEIVQWNSRGDLLAVSSDKQNILIYSIAGELVADFRSHLFMGPFIRDIKWHPSKDIVAVSYGNRLVLWSADGTIIKQINSNIEYSFRDISWNISTNQLAVNQYYAFDRQYYHQIVLFDDNGTMIKQLSPIIDFTWNIEWLDPTKIVINSVNAEIIILDTENETLATLIEGSYSEMAVNPHQNLIIAIRNPPTSIIQWKDNHLAELADKNISDDILAISPYSKHSIIYQPSYQLRTLNHQSHTFENYPTIKFNETIKYASWHPHKPILAILVDNEIQLWQLPE
ncbi:hypothetical protein [Herpetosiphon llansteffanensis]|uniref:WD40 domain-containing protein n=1 Tax=Herpetosiphon llansteffanensis TaxID=2094568 RepID=UPI000D7C244A|nr:hypothetical protein [Herpetosiphon llansteffanensis]